MSRVRVYMIIWMRVDQRHTHRQRTNKDRRNAEQGSSPSRLTRAWCQGLTHRFQVGVMKEFRPTTIYYYYAQHLVRDTIFTSGWPWYWAVASPYERVGERAETGPSAQKKAREALAECWTYHSWALLSRQSPPIEVRWAGFDFTHGSQWEPEGEMHRTEPELIRAFKCLHPRPARWPVNNAPLWFFICLLYISSYFLKMTVLFHSTVWTINGTLNKGGRPVQNVNRSEEICCDTGKERHPARS